MRMISLGDGRYITAEDVVCIIELAKVGDKQYMNRAKESGLLVNVSGSRKDRTAVFMRNGCVLITGMTADTIRDRVSVAVD